MFAAREGGFFGGAVGVAGGGKIEEVARFQVFDGGGRGQAIEGEADAAVLEVGANLSVLFTIEAVGGR